MPGTNDNSKDSTFSKGSGQYLWEFGTGKWAVTGGKIYCGPVDFTIHGTVQNSWGTRARLKNRGIQVFWSSKKEGRNFFWRRKTWGLLLFFTEKRKGPLFIFIYQKGGQRLFFTSQASKSLFADSSEPEAEQLMSLLKSENKLLEITCDPSFEDIEWKYCIFGAVQLREGVGAKIFFDGLNMGANTLFQVPYMGARFFFEVEKARTFFGLLNRGASSFFRP